MGSFSKIKRNKGKIIAGIIAAAAAVALATGVSSSGAFFSDSHNGSVKGTLGSIKVSPTSSMTLTYENMLPGEPQTVTLTYANSGRSTEDVWLTFPNATALSALNDLGTYGELHVTSNGTEIFASTNLNDHTNTCSAPECKPLPAKLKLASKVLPGGTGEVAITFNYAGKLSTQPADGTVAEFNVYPAPSGTQYTVNAADGTGSGLPYRLVATQVNQTP